MNNNPINHSWKHGIWPIEIRKCFKKLNYEHTHTHTHILWLFLTQFVINIWVMEPSFFLCLFLLLDNPFMNPNCEQTPKPWLKTWDSTQNPKKKKEKSFNKLQYLCILFAQLLLTNVWPTLGNSVNISWEGGGGGGGEDEEVYIKCSHNSSWIARDKL